MLKPKPEQISQVLESKYLHHTKRHLFRISYDNPVLLSHFCGKRIYVRVLWGGQ
jgi:hypothetical protein